MDQQPPVDPPETPKNHPQSDSTLHLRLEVPHGTRLHISVETHAPDGTWLEERDMVFTNPPADRAQPDQVTAEGSQPPRAWWKIRWNRLPLASILFALALAVYLLTRLVHLADFPIYFFTDEAIQTVCAADLVRDQFAGYDGEILPTYFQNGGQYNLSVSVYLQVLPYLMFGKSVFNTRAVSAVLSLIAALSISLILKKGFNIKPYWVGVLLLAVTPVWFLHSRTAFETVLATSFYAAFLFAYIQYRLHDPRWLYAAIGIGALTFYTYSPAQLVMAVTALLLFLSDLKYHWQNRKLLLRGLGLALLLAVPYIRFQINHPGETTRHLTILGSYWVQTIPLGDKISRFFTEYLRGLNPLYWYNPEPEGLVRHIMKGYGYLWRWSLPLAALGFVAALVKIRHPSNRVVLAALLAAPAGGALVGLGITRLLFMVIPAVLLSAIGLVIGLEALIKFFNRRWKRLPARTALLLLTFALLSAVSVTMMTDTLNNGPTWYNDYGLGGMQWGARQIFSAVNEYVKEHPGAKIILSPSWSNGTDVVMRFFYSGQPPFQLGSIDGYIDYFKQIDPQTVFVMIPEEFKRMEDSKKFKLVNVDQVVDYPDGQPGFYFTRLRYVDDIEAIFKAESEARRVLVEETTALQDGSPVNVAYSYLDMGRIVDIFDNNPGTLIRTREANPLKLVVTFASPRNLQGVNALVGGVPTRLTVNLTVNGQSKAVSFVQEVGDAPNPRGMSVDFGQTYEVVQVTLEVLSSKDSEPAHVHLWEITFR